MKLIIAGSRTITDYNLLIEALLESGFWKKYGREIEVVSGTAGGVDMLGEELAVRNNLKLHRFPADWKNLDAPGAVIRVKNGRKYNARAGIDRNIRMGQFSDGLLAIWDGKSKGTEQMIEWAKNNNLEYYVKKINTP